MGLRSGRHRVLALAAALALASCAGDSPPPDEGSTPIESPSPASPTGESASSPGPTGADTTGLGGELIEAVNLCEELDAATLSEITGLRLADGVFDGAICIWTDRDERGTLTASFGNAEGNTARYVEEVADLDIGTEVTVAGAEVAAAVTITSGSGASRSTRIALVAKVGPDRLSVVLTGRDASLDAAIAVAELATGA